MNFQPVAIGIEPSPYVAVCVVRRVILNEHCSLPSIAASQLFQENEVRGSVEDGVLPVMEASLPQFNGPKNLHALALSGHGNCRGATNPAPGGVQGRILAKTSFYPARHLEPDWLPPGSSRDRTAQERED